MGRDISNLANWTPPKRAKSKYALTKKEIAELQRLYRKIYNKTWPNKKRTIIVLVPTAIDSINKRNMIKCKRNKRNYVKN